MRSRRGVVLFVGVGFFAYVVAVYAVALTPFPWTLLWVVPLAWVVASVARLYLTDLPRRLHRVPNGKCERCGYDLRATPRRCPECGLAPIQPVHPRVNSFP